MSCACWANKLLVFSFVWNFGLLLFTFESLFFQVTQLVPGKHKHQTEYTEFYPHADGSPLCLCLRSIVQFAKPTILVAATVVQWIELSPPNNTLVLLYFCCLSAGHPIYPNVMESTDLGMVWACPVQPQYWLPHRNRKRYSNLVPLKTSRCLS